MRKRILRLGPVLIVGLFIGLLAACPTPTTPSEGDFSVTVQSKTAAHPYFGQGSALGFVVNGTEGEELTLTRGTSYTFSIDTPGHPFYISTDATGGPGAPGEVTDGVSDSQVESGTLVFTPSDAHPELLYYQCALHPNMGWRINIVD